MNDAFGDALRILENIDLGGLIEDTDAMALALIERQRAIDALAVSKFPDVSDDEKDALRARIEAVLTHDAEIMELLASEREHVMQLLGNMVSGRAMARGYGAMREQAVSSVKRTG